MAATAEKLIRMQIMLSQNNIEKLEQIECARHIDSRDCAVVN